MKFYDLPIKKIRHETKDAVSLIFDVPTELREVFEYKSGQYLTIKVKIDGTEFRRSYSISSSPAFFEDLAITVKRTENGLVSTYVNKKIKTGDEVSVAPPFGNFTVYPDPKRKAEYVFVAGGSGITPIISQIKSYLAREEKSKCLLIFQNYNEESIIFKNDIDELIENFVDRFKVKHVLSSPSASWQGLKGRAKSDLIKHLIKSEINDVESAGYYLCGPIGLMETALDAFVELGAEKKNILQESFVADVAKESPDESPDEVEDEIKPRTVKIRLYGEEFEILVQPDETILLAAMREGREPPFSCQIGACATCRATLLSGKVKMDARDALTEEDEARGYVLTCQSHPITDDVFVDYDAN